MAKALTFFTYKGFRDSTGKFHAIFTSGGQNSFTDVSETTSRKLTSKTLSKLSGGETEVVLIFDSLSDAVPTLSFNLQFTGGETELFTGNTTTSAQQLLETYASLSGAITISSDSKANTRDIIDTLYYSKPLYKSLYVFPSSSSLHLDTSSKLDYYYVTDGAAAFIGSTELQNEFLTGLKHSAKGYSSDQLGKFVGGEDNKSLNFSCYTNEKKTGPAVEGVINMLKSVVVGSNEIRVCLNPASSNYYLTGCLDEAWPCVDVGAQADDCSGVTLTADRINTYEILDGGCCASCDGFTVSLTPNTASSGSTADGTLDFLVLAGTANYSYTVTPSDLDEVLNSAFSTISTTSSSASFTVSSMYSGYYDITVTDASGCTFSQQVYVGKEGAGEAAWGCKTAAAVNYDSTIADAYASDALCVYCNDVTGLLETGSDGTATVQVLGNWAQTAVTAQPATSNPVTGASLTDGTITIPALEFGSFSPLLDGGEEADWNTFNVSDDFTGSADASPYQYKLYKISADLDYGLQINGDNCKTTITGDGGTSLISTTTNANAGSILAESLAAGRYVVIIAYTNGGAVKDYEECYALKEITVHQAGCMTEGSENYNSLAVLQGDTICSDLEDSCGTLLTPLKIICTPDGGVGVRTDNWLLANGIDDSLNNASLTNLIFHDYLCVEGTSTIIPQTQDDGSPGYTTTNSLGINIPLDGESWGMQLIRIKILTVFADGTTQWSTMVLSAGLVPNNYWGMNFSEEFICEHGPIMSTVVQIFYGVPGIWGEVQNNEHELTDLEQQLHLDCVDCGDPDPEIIGCTDPLALNYNPDADISDNTLCVYPDEPEVAGCTDIAANNYNPLATIDDDSCTYDIEGCTDSTALNYNAGANVDDGTCEYEEIGSDCDLLSDFVIANPVISAGTNTTSTSNTTTGLCDSNDDGTLVITFPDYSGLSLANSVGGVFTLGVFIINADGSVTQYSNYVSGVYTEENAASPEAGDFLTFTEYSNSTYTFTGLSEGNWYSIITYYSTGASTDDGITIVESAGHCETSYSIVPISLDVCSGSTDVYGCTDPEAVNYNVLATVSDGSCTYPCSPCDGECLCVDGTYSTDCCGSDPSGGCTDPLADNFNSNATMDDGSCYYTECIGGDCIDAVSISCIPNTIHRTLESIETCLANSGSSFYNKLITGLSDDCSTMEAWKMVIISEILHKKGLPCVYNCSDSVTPDLSTITCEAKWIANGSLHWNPTNASSYSVGVVVKYSGVFYIAASNTGLNLDPSTTVSYTQNSISGWKVCTPPITFSDTTNYLEKFISFAQSYCKDCGIPPYVTIRDSSVAVSDVITIGGSSIESNGTDFS